MPTDRFPRPRPAGLIASILPSAVAAAESMGDVPGASPGLFPTEEAALSTAGPQRQAEFAAGRLCARTALARLGVPATPLLPGRAGEPQWPAGVTGSITHCAGYRACAVALATDVAAIGVDAEPDAGLPAGLIEAVATSPERAWIRQQMAAVPAVCWDRLLFSAKEAVCKLWYPLTGQWLGLREAAVFPATTGTFSVHLPRLGQVPGNQPATRMTGRWLARGGLIVTVITWTPATTGCDCAATVQSA
ncbi:MAG TPA: 4'-phosphopantetheinyl transferase superfamily protein [Streptosporangiaceae bacterium]